MEGNSKVDELMRPVRSAIERHVKDNDAVTDIYNRAYEALMNSMDVKENELNNLYKVIDKAVDCYFNGKDIEDAMYELRRKVEPK